MLYVDVIIQFERKEAQMTDYGFPPPQGEYSSLVLVRVLPDNPASEEMAHIPIGLVLITELARSCPKWKMPGGHVRSQDTSPEATATRELEEETGLAVKPDGITLAFSEYRERPTPHEVHVFVANIKESDAVWMNNHHPGNEGEEPKLFTMDEVWNLMRTGEMLFPHQRMLTEYGLLIPPPDIT